MKSPRLLFVSLLAGCFLSAPVFAADPSGSWKWSVEFNGQSFESTAKFEARDGQLTGTLSGQMGEMPISDGSFKDGVVAFSLVIDGNGNTFVIKYHGKLEADAIVGSIDVPGFNGGEPVKLDWKAARIAEPKKPDEPAKSR
ncbi:MAG TPA: hypothetical protein VG838_11230 [Opitutaceae bacterium]|nr:hypothetical protein [Opitutaceae bacterium]